MLNFLTTTAAPGADLLSTVFMLVVTIGIFYFMLIRPENKRKKESEEMRASLRNGDEIVTIGGIYGVIVDIKEHTIVLETGADRVRLELAKWSVSSNETASKKAKEEAQKAKEAKAKAKAAKKAEQ